MLACTVNFVFNCTCVVSINQSIKLLDTPKISYFCRWRANQEERNTCRVSVMGILTFLSFAISNIKIFTMACTVADWLWNLQKALLQGPQSFVFYSRHYDGHQCMMNSFTTPTPPPSSPLTDLNPQINTYNDSDDNKE